MDPRQREGCVRERSLCPRRVAELVTAFATQRESRRHVIRILRRVVRRLVTADARARRSLIDAAFVARAAGLCSMDPRQREGCVRERSLCPRRVAELVTAFATQRESRRHVIRILRRVVRRLVTADARARRSLIDAAFVARAAGLCSMDPRQREGCVRERSLCPRRVAELVTAFATQRESRRHVIRILRRVVRRLVTADARARRSLIDAAFVARAAGLCSVGSRQGECRVLERRPCPRRVAEPVTPFAAHREARAHMVRRPRGVVGRLVAADARSRRSPINTAPMATRARLRGVRPGERKRRVVPLALLP